MSTLTGWMDRVLYPVHQDWWDYKRFDTVLQERIRPEYSVLDYGAGRGSRFSVDLRGKVKRVVGVDPDQAALQNPFLDEAKILPLPAGTIPYGDGTFDVVFSRDAMEHVSEPEVAFKEIYRVLKPGGFFLSKTPNRWGYVALIASLTPHSLHVRYNRLRGVTERDIFPTVYRCNSPGKVQRYARQVGFKVVEIEMLEGRPEYLRINALLYVLGFLYERIINSSSLFSRFRGVMIFVLLKPHKMGQARVS